MRVNFGKKIIAMGLAAVLCFGDVMPAFADAVEEPIQITVDASELNDFSDDADTNESAVEEIVEEAPAQEEINDEAIQPAEEGIEATEGTEAVEEAEAEDKQDEEAEAQAEETEEVAEETEEVEVPEEEVPMAGSVSDNDVSSNDVAVIVSKTFSYENDDVTVLVTLADENDLPENAVLCVEVIEVTAEMEEAVEATAAEDETATVVCAYDIHFEADGEEVQPENPVEVSILAKEVEADSSVFHFDEEACEVTDMQAEAAEGEVVFEAPHFSAYVVVNKVKTSGTQTKITESNYFSLYFNKGSWSESSSPDYSKNGKAVQCRFYINDSLKGTYPSISTYYVNGDNNSYAQNVKVNGIADGYTLTDVKLNDISVSTGKISNNEFNSDITFSNRKTKKSADIIDIYLTYEVENVGVLKLFDYNASEINKDNGSNRAFQFSDSPSTIKNDTKNPNFNMYTDGSGIYAGIVKRNLVDGYPVINNSTNESLSYLFSSSTTGVNWGDEVTGLFQKDADGYYYYDSNNTKATLDEDSKSFILNTKANSNPQFFPFDEIGSSSHTFHFGLTYENTFIQPVNGKVGDKDMIFEFSGDDDVWVFIDDVLVLDIGGIHQKASGSINFATGAVSGPDMKKDNNSSGNSYSKNDTIYSLFSKAGYTEEQLNTKFEKVGSNYRFKDLSSHTIKVFYFERGAGSSNFKIKFNLQSLPQATAVVTKQVVGTTSKTSFDFSIKEKNGDFVAAGTKYQIWANGTRLAQDGTVGENGSFTLAAGQSAYFTALTQSATYVVTETDVDASEVYINDESTAKEIATDKTVSSEITVAQEGTAVTFRNVYLKNDLTVTKTASAVGSTGRVFKIDITADYDGTEVSVIPGSGSAPVDVALVIDTSGSMIFTDAKIIDEKTSNDAYNALSVLNEGKVYFDTAYAYDEKTQSYGSGESLSKINKSYFCSGAVSDGYVYGVPYNKGRFIFCVDHTWYYKNLKDNSLQINTSGATKITKENCPKTIYTNRSEMMITAAKSFVDDLAKQPTNRIAIVKFNDSSITNEVIGMTALSTDNLATVKSKLDLCTGVYYTATYPNGALRKAYSYFNDDADTTGNYTVYFADGDYNGTLDTTAVSNLRSKSTVYAIGVAAATQANLNNIATTPASGEPSDKYVKTASNASELASLFTQVVSSMSLSVSEVAATGATVKDVIDDRFVVVDASGNKISGSESGVDFAGGKLYEKNGICWVEWTNQTIGHGKGKNWSNSIYVKAKDDFLGGNVVPTNGSDSFVRVGSKTEYLPQPKVNVALLSMTDVNSNEVIFLGDEIVPLSESFATSVNVNNADGTKRELALTEEIKADLLDDGSASVNYTYGANADVLGTITYSLVGDRTTHVATHAGDPCETYTLTVSYNPYSVSTRNGGTGVVGTEVAGPVSGTATHTIKVVDGKISVVKVINAKNIEWTDGDPIFTFNISKLDKDGNVEKTITKIAHFKRSDIDTSKDEVYLQINFEGLAKGDYRIEELATLGYEFESITNEVTFGDVKATYTNVTISGQTATVSLGEKKDNGFVDLGVAQVRNKKVNEYFMDRDEVVNTVTKSADGTITITQDSKREKQVFSTKAELDAYVRSLSAKNSGNN